ncbi:hypothetical protein CK203_058780 [Vitis vinifera]|uniref:Uncharacterized protein n=1 Tax=Vitis vinifera TaxID=29760 RepID=A0A438FTJ4_VITVI|nr:hypothetical protein CK203_058780 [Vitis vinifera]
MGPCPFGALNANSIKFQVFYGIVSLSFLWRSRIDVTVGNGDYIKSLLILRAMERMQMQGLPGFEVANASLFTCDSLAFGVSISLFPHKYSKQLGIRVSDDYWCKGFFIREEEWQSPPFVVHLDAAVAAIVHQEEIRT